jgi:predicted transport protein
MIWSRNATHLREQLMLVALHCRAVNSIRRLARAGEPGQIRRNGVSPLGDIKLFEIKNGQVGELLGATDIIEKSVQTLFETNLEALLGVRFLASEFTTTHGGRIDTLGLDENGCPVILEYKRASNENVINQGLFYLDWLMDHRKDFQWLVLEKLGKEAAEAVDWSAPRLVCIAGDFNRYDDHAVKQIQRNIELIRYRRFRADLLMLDLIAATAVKGSVVEGKPSLASQGSGLPTKFKTVSTTLSELDDHMLDRFEALRAFLMALGDDVQETTLRFYIAFKRIKNFACIEFRPTTGRILVYVKANPSEVPLEPGFTRDVSQVGHFGTGDLEITLSKSDDLERAKPLIQRSYEAS